MGHKSKSHRGIGDDGRGEDGEPAARLPSSQLTSAEVSESADPMNGCRTPMADGKSASSELGAMRGSSSSRRRRARLACDG